MMMDWSTLVGLISGVALGTYAATRVYHMNGRSEEYDRRITELLSASHIVMDRLEDNDDRIEVTVVHGKRDTSDGIHEECNRALQQ